jgi:tight adherence protein B
VALAAIGAGAAIGAWAWLGNGVTVPVLPAIAGGVGGATGAAALGRTAAYRTRRRADAALVEAVGGLAADLRAGQQPAEARAALAGPAGRHPAVVAVWSVSERTGASAAAVLDRVEQDLRARQDQRREVAAALSGARSTSTLLAVLPLLGIGLGAGMGAHPVRVLLGQPRGQLALVVGVVLEALGVFWTSRIIASAEDTR